MANPVKAVGRALGKSILKVTEDVEALSLLLPEQWTILLDVSQRLSTVLDPTFVLQEDTPHRLHDRVAKLKYHYHDKPDMGSFCKILTMETNILVRQIESWKTELDQRASKLADRENELIAIAQQSEVERQAYRDKIHQTKRQHEQESSDVAQQHLAEVTRKSRDHDEYVARLDQAHGAKINEMTNQQLQMQASYENVLENLKYNHAVEINNINSVMREQIQRHQQEIKKLTEDRNQREAKLEKRLMDTISGLRQSLIARDDAYVAPFLGLEDTRRFTDEDVKSQFLELVLLVDGAARLKWQDKQQIWDESALRKLNPAQNPRLLKKNILQDCIWFTLHKYIFCSPFRVFGKEGEVLEKQWKQQGGSGDDTLANGLYTWPKPSIETERWRYITIRECRSALAHPLPSKYDPQAKLQEGYKANLEDLRSELRDMLVAFVTLEDSDIHSIEALTDHAATTWLTFVMQRCRIVMILQASKSQSPVDKVENVRKGFLELDLNPRLGRYGNSMGDDLTDFMTIAGCEGEVVRLP